MVFSSRKLAEVAAASSVKPIEAVSDEQGKVVYSDMEEGMYLAIGAAKSSVKVTPMLLTVPFASTEEGLDLRCTGLSKGREEQHCRYYMLRRDFIVLNPNTFETG